MDPLNSSRCMPIILKLVDHMRDKFAATWSPKELPKWMAEIHQSMTDKGTWVCASVSSSSVHGISCSAISTRV